MPYAVAFVGLVFAVTLFVLGQRALGALVAHQGAVREQHHALRDRELDLKEREVAMLEQKGRSSESEAIPEDLVQRIQAWDDEFAKADEERNIRVLYGQLKDWDLVRRHLPSYTARA